MMPVHGGDDAELAQLLRDAIAGDERAYQHFLRRVAALTRDYCRRRISGATVDPEDVVQETLLAIHVKRHTWRPDGPVMPWVYAIARFKLVDAFRRRGQHIEVEIDRAIEQVPQPQSEALGEREIRRVVGSLVTGQKAVVLSVSVEGRSVGETAKILGMTENAVRVALHRGLAAIARRFGQS